jgi:type III pantothenate kinase
MTWLLFDAGNSALKWALAEARAPAQGGVDARALAFGGTLALSPDLHGALARVLRQRVVGPVEFACGCSVAGADVRPAIDDAVKDVLDVPVTWFDSEPEFAAGGVHLRNGYRNPMQLGADRWHAMLAARAAWPDRALVVVNAGTATTVDCVSADGRFVGGVIAPGVRLMLDSLSRQTAQLPLADGEHVAHPDNTDDAITTGILDSQLGLIERRVRRFAAEAGPVLLLLDGGNAQALRPVLDAQLAAVRYERHLVLRGILIRARAQMPLLDRVR